jgi:hypothetical protein
VAGPGEDNEINSMIKVGEIIEGRQKRMRERKEKSSSAS